MYQPVAMFQELKKEEAFEEYNQRFERKHSKFLDKIKDKLLVTKPVFVKTNSIERSKSRSSLDRSQ